MIKKNEKPRVGRPIKQKKNHFSYVYLSLL